jgi:hypothetical protein
MDRREAPSRGPSGALLCPSAQPEMADSVIFAVIGGTVSEPWASYLEQPIVMSDDVARLVEPLHPTEAFRFAAPCAQSGCQHFTEGACSLAARTVEQVAPATATLPPCRIRPRCRWYREQGRAACHRCPLVVTTDYAPSDARRRAAKPSVAIEQSDRPPRRDR